MKIWLGILAGAAGIILIAALAVLLFLMIPKGHAAVDMQPGDQKAGMDMYEDAEGPPAMGIPIVGSSRMDGWGYCMKPGVRIGEDKHGNGIFAEDNEVIWRCMQTHPTGELIDPAEAPVVYCIVQNPKVIKKHDQAYYACYHNYGVIFATYEFHWGKSPLILPDEIEYVPTTEMK